MPKKPNKSTAIERLTPNAVTITVKGEELRVATDASENSIMNMIMASQMRSMIQKAMEDYRNDEVKLTPKEIRDLAGAAKDIATFSAEVYAAAEPITQAPKPTEAPTDVTDINFESLHNVPEVKSDPETGDPSETMPV